MTTTPLSSSLTSLHPQSKLTQSHLTQIQIQAIKPTSSLFLINFQRINITRTRFILRASEKKNDSQPEIEIDNSSSSEEQLSEQLGTEIKKAMKEREKVEDSNANANGFLSGVIDEIGRIEWPEFGKVIGTTGVVLGVIAGSSVVLLTVNAVLAELSDRIFAGKGVQDFFG